MILSHRNVSLNVMIMFFVTIILYDRLSGNVGIAKSDFFDVLELRVGVEFVLPSSLPSTPVTSINVDCFLHQNCNIDCFLHWNCGMAE